MRNVHHIYVKSAGVSAESLAKVLHALHCVLRCEGKAVAPVERLTDAALRAHEQMHSGAAARCVFPAQFSLQLSNFLERAEQEAVSLSLGLF